MTLREQIEEVRAQLAFEFGAIRDAARAAWSRWKRR